MERKKKLMINGTWIVISFWHFVDWAWQRGESSTTSIDMGISSGCNMACTFCYGVIQNRMVWDKLKKIFTPHKFSKTNL